MTTIGRYTEERRNGHPALVAALERASATELERVAEAVSMSPRQLLGIARRGNNLAGWVEAAIAGALHVAVGDLFGGSYR